MIRPPRADFELAQVDHLTSYVRFVACETTALTAAQRDGFNVHGVAAQRSRP